MGEEQHEVQHLQEEDEQKSSAEHTSAAQQVILPFDGHDSPFGGVAVSGIDMQEERFQEAGSIRKGEYVTIKGQPCRVLQIDRTAKAWKGPRGGCFQVHIIARGIFTGKKEDIFLPVTQKVTMPFVKRQECTVLDIGIDGEMSLLTPECDTKDDVNLPTGAESDSELAKRIQTSFADGSMVVIIVLSACGREKVVECKIMDSPCQKPSRQSG